MKNYSYGDAVDILDRGFFAHDALPPLSVDRVLKSQIDLMYEFLRYPDRTAEVD